MTTMHTITLRALKSGLALVLAATLGRAGAAIPIQHWTQPSGVQVYLAESHGIPMVDMQIDFDAGARRDPRDKAGLARVTAGMASKGVLAGKRADGSAEPALDENGLSEAWADLGAGFGATASSDRMGFSLRSLSYPDLLPRAVALAARQLGQPAFPSEVWQRERERIKASLLESNTRPATLAGRAFATAVYGEHPYGYEMTADSLSRITVADMAAVYATSITPCRAKVSVVGDVTRAQADSLVAQLFARLAPGASSAGHCAAMAAVPEVAALVQAQELRIPFDSAQAHLLLGQPGFKRDDPDFFALTLGNYVLGGGGFVSRLTEEVRQKRGLTYGVYSYFSPGLHAGAFTIGLQTRPEQTGQALAVTREVLERFVREGPTQAELDAAKANLVGGFALRIDSNRKLLDNVSNIAWNNLPLDYLDTWTQQVEKVTLADVRAAFARKLQPERMVTVVLGARETGG